MVSNIFHSLAKIPASAKCALARLLLVLVLGLIGSTGVQAGIGVNFDTANPTALPEIGNVGGGSSFGPTFCPQGQVLSGFNFWRVGSYSSQANGAGVAIQGRCSRIDSMLGLSAGDTTVRWSASSEAGNWRAT